MSENRDCNLMTTNDARKKRCCQFPNGTSLICDADGCMAWRWASSLTVHNPTRTPGAANQQVKQTLGFCGLAGKP